jgi:hypothetical protein
MPPKPIALSDSELDAVMTACQPLAVERRDAFLQEIASALRRCNGEIGPGSLHRILAEAQRKYLPAISGIAGASKYR